MRGREQKWAGAVIQKIDQVAGAADVSAERADGFGECADLNVHAAMHFEMIYRATTISTEDAGGMGIVDHHDRSILPREFTQRRERADIAVHGEYAVGDQQLFSWLVFNARQAFFGLRHVFMLEDENLG